MDGAPVFPNVADVIDPLSGDRLGLNHVQGSGADAYLEHARLMASFDRKNNNDYHRLVNLTLRSALFNKYIRNQLSLLDAVKFMHSWLQCAAGGAGLGPAGRDAAQAEYMAYAQRCFDRHGACGAECADCCGGFTA
jgi:hypothetical protein